MAGTVSRDEWFIDSGASRHLSPHREMLMDFHASNGPEISVANNNWLKVAGSGIAYVNIDGIDIAIRNVLFVPGLGANSLSVSEMIKAGNVTFNANDCNVFNANNELFMKAKLDGDVYKIEAKQISYMRAKNDDIDWHRRLGHLS